MTNLFKDFVGQESVKRKLEFHLRSHAATAIAPHILLVAPRGYGKTTFAVEFARNLISKTTNKKKNIALINCSIIKNINNFFDNFVIAGGLFGEGEVTYIFDECSEMPEDVTMALLTILNPTKENGNTFLFKGEPFYFNFAKQSFLFATTEPQKVSIALMDRLRRIDFEDYTSNDLAKIMNGALKNVSIEKGLIETISQDIRSSGRQAIAMADDINSHLASSKKTTLVTEDWRHIKKELGILPLGLNDTELRVMKVLKERGETKLTAIASIMNMTRESIQRDIESYLQKKNLIQINPAGRSLTMAGRGYLELINGNSNLK